MLRYIILVWNANNSSDRDTSAAVRGRMQSSGMMWRAVLDRPGMYAACVDQGFYARAATLIDGDRGVIIGTLFSSPELCQSSQPRPIESLSRSQSNDILRSQGRALISDFWGYYVAAIRDPGGAGGIVLRAPVSPLACLYARQGTVNAFFSNVEDCVDLNLSPLSINWDSIAAQVVGGDFLSDETAINGIRAIECGESAHCGPAGCAIHAYWDPRTFLEQRAPARFETAAQDIRRAVEFCIGALSSGHDRLLVKVSGGLDSSIVLSALRRAPHHPSVTAVNYFSTGSGDERFFARTMAGSVGFPLIERARNEGLDLHRFLDCNRTVRPVLNFSAPDTEARNIALARELNATAIFDGECGDNVFGSHPRPGALLECLRQCGSGAQFLGTALDYSLLSKQSLWRTLAMVRREARSTAENPDFSAAADMRWAMGGAGAAPATLASPAAEEHYYGMGDRFLHPWLKKSRRIAPGSQALLFGLITVTSAIYHSPFSSLSDPPRISPLVSQPLLESVLQMPAYLHFRFAQDRAVARAAFADLLPPEILQRGLGKGGPGSWAKEVVERNSGFLREFLLEGILVGRGLVDRTKLEAALSCRIVKSTVLVGDILAKLYIEAWLRSWSAAEAAAVA
ncbi:MAG: asparagine synthase-related protein [Steroidobacteraceae bacterium]